MTDPSYAFVASLIWAFSPIYYRTFLRKFDVLALNLLRTSIASAVMVAPALWFGLGGGLPFALLSGAVTLGLGDSLFLLSIREMGASVATPVVYTYVLFVQLTASAVGVGVPASNVVAALMVVAGVYVMSKGGEGKPRARGILIGLAAAAVWTGGQDLIQLATSAGGSPFAIAFSRNLAATVALGAAVLATRRTKVLPPNVSGREWLVMAAVIVSDLVIGSFLYVYSISLAGVAVTVILTSLSPLMTQVFSKMLGKESPSRLDFGGGALIVCAVVLAWVF